MHKEKTPRLSCVVRSAYPLWMRQLLRLHVPMVRPLGTDSFGEWSTDLPGASGAHKSFAFRGRSYHDVRGRATKIYDVRLIHWHVYSEERG